MAWMRSTPAMGRSDRSVISTFVTAAVALSPRATARIDNDSERGMRKVYHRRNTYGRTAGHFTLCRLGTQRVAVNWRWNQQELRRLIRELQIGRELREYRSLLIIQYG